MKPVSTSKGFTLIELLIVISIIGILSAIGLVTYSNFLEKSRDSRRQSDLKFIQSALEEYHADQIAYPSSVTSGSSLSYGTRVYMNQVPVGPKGESYLYSQSGCGLNSASYCLGVSMETTPVPQGDPSCTFSGANYCVTRP